MFGKMMTGDLKGSVMGFYINKNSMDFLKLPNI
jgi:hypothetical protein